MKAEAGFTELEGLDLSASPRLIASREINWCSSEPLWDALKVEASQEQLKGIKNAGILMKVRAVNIQRGAGESLDLEILASMNSVVKLSPYSEYANKLMDGEDNFDLFHLHVPASHTSVVEVFPCFGAVELQVFRTVKELRRDKIYHQISKLERGRIIFKHIT